MNMVYAALFRPDEEYYNVTFPDIPDCFTYGDDLAHAIEMATEVLGLYLSVLLDDEDDIPTPTPIDQLDPKDGFLTYISADPEPFRDKKTKFVKKTLTIPAWLNKEAEKAGINFSKTLREALKLALAK